jgi:branched-chain amino acid transport system permease protein
LTTIYDAGLLFSVVVALLTTGFVLTNTISGFPNLGHTLNLGVGMFISFSLGQILNITPFITIPASLFVTGLYNLATYLVIFKRVKKPELASLAGLGLLLAGSNILVILLHYLRIIIDTNWWCGPSSMRIDFFESGLHFHYPKNEYYGIVESTYVSIFIILLSMVFYWFIKRKFWVYYLSYIENSELAQVMGINTDIVEMFSWFIAGGLGGIAGSVFPYIFKGYPGRASQLLSIVVFASGAFAGMKSPKFGFLAGLVVGFLDIIFIALGQAVIGVWVGEFRNLFSIVIMSMSFYFMSRNS